MICIVIVTQDHDIIGLAQYANTSQLRWRWSRHAFLSVHQKLSFEHRVCIPSYISPSLLILMSRLTPVDQAFLPLRSQMASSRCITQSHALRVLERPIVYGVRSYLLVVIGAEEVKMHLILSQSNLLLINSSTTAFFRLFRITFDSWMWMVLRHPLHEPLRNIFGKSSSRINVSISKPPPRLLLQISRQFDPAKLLVNGVLKVSGSFHLCQALAIATACGKMIPTETRR